MIINLLFQNTNYNPLVCANSWNRECKRHASYGDAWTTSASPTLLHLWVKMFSAAQALRQELSKVDARWMTLNSWSLRRTTAHLKGQCQIKLILSLQSLSMSRMKSWGVSPLTFTRWMYSTAHVSPPPMSQLKGCDNYTESRKYFTELLFIRYADMFVINEVVFPTWNIKQSGISRVLSIILQSPFTSATCEIYSNIRQPSLIPSWCPVFSNSIFPLFSPQFPSGLGCLNFNSFLIDVLPTRQRSVCTQALIDYFLGLGIYMCDINEQVRTN
jgi:hypothetical protein